MFFFQSGFEPSIKMPRCRGLLSVNQFLQVESVHTCVYCMSTRGHWATVCDQWPLCVPKCPLRAHTRPECRGQPAETDRCSPHGPTLLTSQSLLAGRLAPLPDRSGAVPRARPASCSDVRAAQGAMHGGCGGASWAWSLDLEPGPRTRGELIPKESCPQPRCHSLTLRVTTATPWADQEAHVLQTPLLPRPRSFRPAPPAIIFTPGLEKPGSTVPQFPAFPSQEKGSMDRLSPCLPTEGRRSQETPEF